MLNINSLEWLPPLVQDKPTQNALTYTGDTSFSSNSNITKLRCDLGRICEVEDSVVEWYQAEYFRRPDETLDARVIAHLAHFFEIASN